MTAVDEVSALTQSIAEHAVQAFGPKHMTQLSVTVSSVDFAARVTVQLRNNTDKEQRRALEKFFDLQDLFFDDVSMTLAFGTDEDLPSAHNVGSRQYSFA